MAASPPGAVPLPSLLRPPTSSVLLAQQRYHNPPFATCLTWDGLHYRTFDGKHFRFGGNCTYALAAASDGTWAVYVSSGSGGCVPGQCRRVSGGKSARDKWRSWRSLPKLSRGL